MYRSRQPVRQLRIAATAITLTAITMGLSACGSHPPAATLAPVPPSAGTLDAARLAAAASEPDQWFTPSRDASGSYYSPLTDINVENVSRLGFAWE
jgi:glucose dehydrogenase